MAFGAGRILAVIKRVVGSRHVNIYIQNVFVRPHLMLWVLGSLHLGADRTGLLVAENGTGATKETTTNVGKTFQGIVISIARTVTVRPLIWCCGTGVVKQERSWEL